MAVIASAGGVDQETRSEAVGGGCDEFVELVVGFVAAHRHRS
ncbi:hypothetical protein OEM_23610 [Mycobacterium intracellulare subsp. yongonense 05-1390]|nr:hypothetical protein OEM_23610 [Mycobacterium intracellulare subsp. yongonense 05-1390]